MRSLLQVINLSLLGFGFANTPLSKKKYSWNVVDIRQRSGTHTYTITHRKKTLTVMLIKLNMYLLYWILVPPIKSMF
jgi:hypothetical protein